MKLKLKKPPRSLAQEKAEAKNTSDEPRKIPFLKQKKQS